MRIAIFGLGYVGSVSAGCLAEAGHEVVGVDVKPEKVDCIQSGRSPIVETGLESLIQQGVAAGRLRATTDAAEAIRETDMCWLCVSTPSRSDGGVDTGYLERVCEQVGEALAARSGNPYAIVIRSTVLPGTTDEILAPILEARSGLRVGEDFHLCYHPELLREGVAIEDFRRPSKIVIGASDDRNRAALESLYAAFTAPLLKSSVRVAEMVKYTDNVWHALKIGFANEIGSFSRQLGIDGREVMRIFCRDTKLNISDEYLRPAFAFGGSCLPKDMRALVHRAGAEGLDLPILGAVLPSNAIHVDRALEIITGTGRRRIGMLGLSFKAGTDDLRESPLVTVAERLVEDGYDLRIYDHNVNLSRLVGANREYIREHIPHVGGLMVQEMAELVDHAETLVVGNRDPRYREAANTRMNGKILVDLVGLWDELTNGKTYRGICW